MASRTEEDPIHVVSDGDSDGQRKVFFFHCVMLLAHLLDAAPVPDPDTALYLDMKRKLADVKRLTALDHATFFAKEKNVDELRMRLGLLGSAATAMHLAACAPDSELSSMRTYASSVSFAVPHALGLLEFMYPYVYIP